MSTNISSLMSKINAMLKKVAPIGKWIRAKANVSFTRIFVAAGL